MTPVSKKIIYILVLFISYSFYGQDIVTDRPDQTESSSTVGNGNIQIEMGVLYQQTDNNSIHSFFGPSTLLRYGITNGIELRFVSQFESTKIDLDGGEMSYSGFNDLEFGTKFQVFKKENVNTEIAFLSHIIFSTAKENLTTDNVGVINKLSISHVISDKIGLGYNVGYDNIAKQSSFTYSLAIGIALSDKISFYVEPYGSYGKSNSFESNFDSGLTFLVNRSFQLDVSFGTGLNNDMRYVASGFSWKIPNFLVQNKS